MGVQRATRWFARVRHRDNREIIGNIRVPPIGPMDIALMPDLLRR